MSSGVDLSQFYEMFFDEADELLADMEQSLLELDVQRPDIDKLNAIFRAAHSIKGGAGTFGCFTELAHTTHLLENLLDALRNQEMTLTKEMIDVFLETKHVLADQIDAYRESRTPDEAAYERICAQLQAIAQAQNESGSENSQSTPAILAPTAQSEPQAAPPVISHHSDETADSRLGAPLRVTLTDLNEKDAAVLRAEMAIMGDILREQVDGTTLDLWIDTTESAANIEAVCCFVINAKQVSVRAETLQTKNQTKPLTAIEGSANELTVKQPTKPEDSDIKPSETAKEKSAQSNAPGKDSTLRVGVEKVDQIINLVGELVITQAMLVQTASSLDPVLHSRLLSGIEHLERNARDLQEAVMSIRMMPMDYVFSRFPRVVRESATKLNKQIKLETRGAATELDKSLIERIIDPLTHLVRNSIDHGIEAPDVRIAKGKKPEGTLILAAQHLGGQIVIEVSDDGAGLSRERILKKAISQGFPVNESTPDEELWQLIFAPGFSTAEKITEISGRGVGMDVVRRNIQDMGGHIQLQSRVGQGTTTRIFLPLTLAILDGMSVQVGEEIFVLPLSHVTESLQPTNQQIHELSQTEQVLHVRGEYLPMISMRTIFNVENAQTDLTKSIAVILQAEDNRFALIVDHLVGQQQVVVKNLESNYRKVPGVSGATILGDGSVALIADVFALMRMTRSPLLV